MKIPMSWLREWVDLPETPEQIREILDDLGLVVEGLDVIGEGLEDVVVARVDQIIPIEGADRIRLVTVDAGQGPLDIVCGAMNFEVGNKVPLAPVGAVLPGGFEIARRTMKGVVSNGMLCSAKELALSDDHGGLYILDDLTTAKVGAPLIEALAIQADVIFNITVEGNRPDAWCVAGVARDLATRLQRPLKEVRVAEPTSATKTNSIATAGIDAPDLCGRLMIGYIKNVRVVPSPAWIAQRLLSAGMRPISNIVDVSNLVMLELGQPNHAYDAEKVAGYEIRVREARVGESLTTLDGVNRPLAQPGRGLGDAGVDCVIVDGSDQILGLAGIMGGLDSEITESTNSILLEAAFFDPMTIARSSKRHGLRSEASSRFERGVDPELAPLAVARFVHLLQESCPDLEWFDDVIDVRGNLPTPPTIELRRGDVKTLLGTDVENTVVKQYLTGLGFSVRENETSLEVTAPSARLDIRPGACGRADVIEEIGRMHSYQKLSRRTPNWPEPGGLSRRQLLRRRIRDTAITLGANEAWTATLVSEAHVNRTHPNGSFVRITNPLAIEESILRTTLITGLVDAWAKNAERGLGNTSFFEIGFTFAHPSHGNPRRTKGGVGGRVTLDLPEEREWCTMVLGREGDDALSAVAVARALLERIGLMNVVVRSGEVVPGLHPTRCATLTEQQSGLVLGVVGEVNPQLVEESLELTSPRRLGVIEVDVAAIEEALVKVASTTLAAVPSRYPSALIDLAFVTPDSVHAQDLADEIRATHAFVESVELFDVYRGSSLPAKTRSLAYSIRLSSSESTLSEKQVSEIRDLLIAAASKHGAALR